MSPRTDAQMPGVWRLRLPCPWPGVPHGNAWAVASAGGVVLFDSGVAGPGRLSMFESALAQAGFGIDSVRLVVCTHAHSDHIGLAGPIAAAAGCELWAHPAWHHISRLAEDPGAVLEDKVALAVENGFPQRDLPAFRAEEDDGPGVVVEGLRHPDQTLTDGAVVNTDLGPWFVHSTPGHAPSHIVIHQPDHRILVSGDHLLGRVAPSFDHGLSPDPVGGFLSSLDTVEELDLDLCLPGHGRAFSDPTAKIAETRARVSSNLGRVEAVLATGERSTFEVVSKLRGAAGGGEAGWTLPVVLSYLEHLVLRGAAEEVVCGDLGPPSRRWTIV